jgi:hypothetical protein
MTGSTNAEQTGNIVTNLDTAQAVQGTPGAWTISSSITIHALLGAKLAVVGGGPAPTVTAGQALLAQAAVDKSNAAAASTTGAASGNPTTASTASGVITNIAQGLSNLADTPANIQQLEAGTTATLHWWGWEADLNESATQALLKLLGTDVAGLVSIATALAAISAPLAAIAAVVGAISTGFDVWITAEDTKKNGVIINGYLWVGISVSGQ